MNDLIERIRNELFGNLVHYRQRCIGERDDAKRVAEFMAQEVGATRSYFAFRQPDGAAINAMGELPYDPTVPGDRERAEAAAADMAAEKVGAGYYPAIETVAVTTSYKAERVGIYRAP